MSLPTIAGVVLTALVLLFLLFRRSPAPQHVAPSMYRKPKTGCVTWVLIGLAVGLALPQLPWLVAHIPLGKLSLPSNIAPLSSSFPSVQGASAAPASDSIVGASSVTASFIDHVLVDAGSPAQGMGAQLVALGKKYNIDPVYALAFYHHESDYGRKGVAVTTKSWGNIRCLNWRGQCDPFTGEYRMYPSILAGAEDWFSLLHSAYIPRGLSTIRTIIPVYAPATDHNNVPAYIQSILTDVQRWRGGKMEP